MDNSQLIEKEEKCDNEEDNKRVNKYYIINIFLFFSVLFTIILLLILHIIKIISIIYFL